MQLRLFFHATENTREGTDLGADKGEPYSAPKAEVKRGNKKNGAPPALVMEAIANENNLREAFKEVAENKGAPGPDGQSIEEVKKHLNRLIPQLSQALLKGEYRPGEVRRVWIPKSGGGKRGLGIPNVIDRLVQQGTLRVLQSHVDPTFDVSSHGFRPGKSCHTAINEAKTHIEDGYTWVVDIDLEKFFDTVNHQRLQAALERRIADKRIITLIKRMLKAGTVMPDGVIVRNEEGTPQGGPLSPLLSNIVLDELDTELRRRGHKFVRYADDCNIYVKSQKAGQRVMESVSRFIEKRMKLKVNRSKSAVANPAERHFLGFRLEYNAEQDRVEIRLSERSRNGINEKVRTLTPRNWGQSIAKCIEHINSYLRGWIGFFQICSAAEERTLRIIDAHIRRRLRAIQLTQWKRKRSIVRNLIRRGVSPRVAWRAVYSQRRSTWNLSHARVVEQAMSNAYFAETLDLESLEQNWRALCARRLTGVQTLFVFG